MKRLTIETKVQPVVEGDAVRVVDEQHVGHVGLVTVVHGQFTDVITPCINVVYVSTDGSKRDPYGAQTERMSSLQHFTQGPSTMPNPGRYWLNV